MNTGSNNGNYHLRFFTSTNEVALCGHATISAFGALLECKLVKDNCTYKIETMVGILEVNIKNQVVFMDMSEPQELKKLSKPEEIKRLAGVMGIPVDGIVLTPQLISTGLPDIILHVKTREMLLALQPDFYALAKLSEEYKVVGVHAFALSNKNEITAYCRNFAPLHDINEEAATGTSNGALAFYLYKNKVFEVTKGFHMHTFLQGESMNRPSIIFCTINTTDSSIAIKVGGEFIVIAKGEIFL